MAIKDQTIIRELETMIEAKTEYSDLMQRALDEIQRLRKLAGCVNGVVDFNEVRKIAQLPDPWASDNMRFEGKDS